MNVEPIALEGVAFSEEAVTVAQYETVPLTPVFTPANASDRRLIYESADERVAVVDERSELAATYRGSAQTELGNHTDVLDGCPKALGIEMLLRSMTPQVIAVDEIATAQDAAAIRSATSCGVGLLATMHAADTGELANKPLGRELLADSVFSRAVLITGKGDQRSYSVKTLAREGLPCCDGLALR